MLRASDLRRRAAPSAAFSVVAFAGCAVLLVSGCSTNRPVSVDQPISPTATVQPATTSASAGGGQPGATPAGSPPASSAAVVATEPGGGTTLFPSHRLVMFYGAAGTSALGVLGDGPPEQVWPRLTRVAASYDRPDVTTVPTFELITWVEQGSAGKDGSYSVRVPDSTIAHYYRVVHAHHGYLVLDIQPGRHEFLDLAKTLRRWLAKPDVGLALDPEWKLYGNQVPDRQIGHTTSSAVNDVSAWLSDLVATHRLPQKLLLVHNFTGEMLRDESHLTFHDNLALAENADGFGYRASKLYDYHLLSDDERLWLGFKLFYREDIHIFTPAQLLAIPNPPDIVDYQ